MFAPWKSLSSTTGLRAYNCNRIGHSTVNLPAFCTVLSTGAVQLELILHWERNFRISKYACSVQICGLCKFIIKIVCAVSRQETLNLSDFAHSAVSRKCRHIRLTAKDGFNIAEKVHSVVPWTDVREWFQRPASLQSCRGAGNLHSHQLCDAP